MPITGVAMGYYGGKGLPFFTTTFKFDESAKNPDAAKQVSEGMQYLVDAGYDSYITLVRGHILLRF